MPHTRPLLVGFLKVYNEVLKGNLPRVLGNLTQYCDEIFICDDGSTDDTPSYLHWYRKHTTVPLHVLRYDDNRFTEELARKQALLERVHEARPQAIFWLDADEVLDAEGTRHIRSFVEHALHTPVAAWRFPEINLWMSTRWHRTDSGFAEGSFIRLWRWSPDLTMDVHVGTHHHQFPVMLLERPIAQAPFSVLHYGNASLQALKWKAIQYYGGLGDVDRHLRFAHATFALTADARLLEAAEVDEECPHGLPEQTIQQILALRNLTPLAGYFGITLPTFNRADTLPRAIESVLQQTYPHWLLYILDDGSCDDTATVVKPYLDTDPRIFYARYPEHRGGVAMNEIGMRLACGSAEWWTRLGSDDWWFPQKLEHDAAILRAGAGATYGPYVVHRNGQLMEPCNPPMSPQQIRTDLRAGTFRISWANVAVATWALKKLYAKHGNFCDPRLRNMEDFCVNARLVTLTDFVYRDGCDGVWTDAADGASGSAQRRIMNADTKLTLALIQEQEITQEPPDEKPPMLPPPQASEDEMFLAEARQIWRIAGTVPFDPKETRCPGHAQIQEFVAQRGKTVLEYGCGSGSDARCYLEQGCNVTLCDIVPENIECAVQNLARAGFHNVEQVLLERSAPLPFSDERFDVANCHGVLHHIPDPLPVMREFFRVLKPGGVIYVMLYTEMLRERMKRQVARLMQEGWTDAQAFGQCTDGANYAVSYSETQGRALLEVAGFEVVNVTVYNNGDFRTYKGIKT